MDPLLCRKRGHSGFLWLPALPGPCRMSDRHQRSKKRWDQSVFFRSHTPLLMPQLLMNPWTKVAGLDLHPSQICYEIAVECFWSFLIHPHLRKHACQLWGSWTREMLQTAEDTKHEDLYSPSRTPCIWNWVHLNCGYPEPFPIHMESHRWLSKLTRQIQIVGFVSKHSELLYPSPEMTPSWWIHTRSL